MRGTTIATLTLGVLLGVALTAGGLYAWRGQIDNSTPQRAGAALSPGEGTQGDGHGESEHAEHERGDEEHGLIRLSPEAMLEADIEVAEARTGTLEEVLSLPGEIAPNADGLAHIVPRVGGIVRRVDKTLGDDVQAGEVMAVLESRELAEAKASYLAAQQRLPLAQAQVAANERLRDKGIVSELDMLAAQRELATAEIEMRAAEQKLHALGVTHEEIAALGEQDDMRLGLYELTAPFAGTVVDRHITLGESVTEETQCFVLADLTTVWVNVTVYAQDIARVTLGQPVEVRSDASQYVARGTISYLSPIIDETTRTATARVVLANDDRRWRPGAFVTATLFTASDGSRILVPNQAIQRIDNRLIVFVAEGEGFEPRTIEIGRQGPTHSEVSSGLSAGDRFVARGAFVLKSELGKGEAGHEH